MEKQGERMELDKARKRQFHSLGDKFQLTLVSSV